MDNEKKTEQLKNYLDKLTKATVISVPTETDQYVYFYTKDMFVPMYLVQLGYEVSCNRAHTGDKLTRVRVLKPNFGLAMDWR